MIKRAIQLEDALSRVNVLLDPHELPTSGLRSASDLVQLALREGWLDDQDVKGSAPAAKKVAKAQVAKRKAKAAMRRNDGL